MKSSDSISRIVELDGAMFHLDGDRLSHIKEVREVPGPKWLLTDFQESLSRCMTVDGPLKYAELQVRRKLQESGEFEESVQVITHWKRKRGRNSTDIFFTAVPSRLAGFYLDELSDLPDHVLVFSAFGMLWNVLRQTGTKEPVAVVLRHDRFAEILVGTSRRVYLANRCVAFDTQPEQLKALWDTVLSDIQSLEQEQHIRIAHVHCLDWIDAGEAVNWPDQWQAKLIRMEAAQLLIDEQPQALSLPAAFNKSTASSSDSKWLPKVLFFSRQLVPIMNVCLLLVAALLFISIGIHLGRLKTLSSDSADLQQQIDQVRLHYPKIRSNTQFAEILKFVEQVDRQKRLPSYQQIVDDLTGADFQALELNRLKIDYAASQVHIELYGDIDASFDLAHGGYQRFLRRLTRLGYRIEESRFETQISNSQLVLKLNRPVV